MLNLKWNHTNPRKLAVYCLNNSKKKKTPGTISMLHVNEDVRTEFKILGIT